MTDNSMSRGASMAEPARRKVVFQAE